MSTAQLGKALGRFEFVEVSNAFGRDRYDTFALVQASIGMTSRFQKSILRFLSFSRNSVERQFNITPSEIPKSFSRATSAGEQLHLPYPVV